jgi:hypothetical protein
MPKGTGNRITVMPANDQPYVAIVKAVADTPGLEPVAVDAALKKGVWIEGKVTDKVSGQPVSCSVEYFAGPANPNLSDYPELSGVRPLHEGQASRKDGSYRVVGLPGPGMVAVALVANYLRATERDDRDGRHEERLSTAPYYIITFTSNYAAIAAIEPAKGSESFKRDITLDPGWTYHVKVVGPDGKPLVGSISVGNHFRPMKTDGFTIRASNPRKPRDLLIQHASKGLVGIAHPPKENNATVTVEMKSGASIAGKLVEADGKPARHVQYRLSFRVTNGPAWAGGMLDSAKPLETGDDGRFTVTCLPADYEFEFTRVDGKYAAGKPLFIKPLGAGEARDLGDIQLGE